jgi:hypothetical protein
MVRSRQILARFRFFLAIFGYDRHDRSLSHKIYLVYAAIFYTAWGFVVLSFLAGGTASFLASLSPSPQAVPHTVVALTTLGLLAWWLVKAYMAARSSPLLFSEEDAYLICQTPADRRSVAVAWLVGQWPQGAAPIWAIAVTLGFALLEFAYRGEFTGADLPHYVLTGLRSLSIVLPLQLGLLAFVWALGAFRLQRDQQRPALFLLPLGLAGLLVAGFLAEWRSSGLMSVLQPPFNTLLWPFNYPLSAAFGLVPWVSGWLLALAWAVLGLLSLLAASATLNLSRAAQESRGLVAQQGQRVQTRLRTRLGDTQPPSRWLRLVRQRTADAAQPSTEEVNAAASNRWQAVVIKDLIQSGRSPRFPQIFAWLGVWVTSLGAFLVAASPGHDWGILAWAATLWALLVIQQSSRRLQADLAIWPVFRSLPIPSRRLLLAEIARPAVYATLLFWASLASALALQPLLSGMLGLPSSTPPAAFPWLDLALLAPFVIPTLSLTGVLDVLRQSKTAELLAGRAPQPGMLALALSVLILLSLGFLLFLFSTALTCWSFPLTLGASLIFARLLLSLSAHRLTRIS